MDPDFAPSLRLLRSSQRPNLRTILAFTKRAQSEATASSRSTDVRIARLRSLRAAFNRSGQDADDGSAALIADIHRMLVATGASPVHLDHHVQALEREASGWQPDTWRDVLTHGRLVAASVGRLALEACGENVEPCGQALDALSTALWVLHGVRHLKGDARDDPPICIPRRFLVDALITNTLSPADGARGQVRAVLDRVLDGVDRLLMDATPLPRQLTCFGMRWHAAVSLCRANKLASALRHRDPFYAPVRLTSADRWLCVGAGLLQQLTMRRH